MRVTNTEQEKNQIKKSDTPSIYKVKSQNIKKMIEYLKKENKR